MLHARELLADVGEISRRFAADRRQRQARRHLDADDIAALKDARLHLAAVPCEHGGLWQGPAQSIRAQCEALRLLAMGDPSVALVATMHPAVLCFWRDPGPPQSGEAAWEAQKRQVFGSVIDGAWWGTITSEPGSAGDIGKTRAVAVPANDGPDTYRVSGEKHFGTGSGATTHVVTTARQPGAEAPEWYFMEVGGVPWDGSTGMKLKAEWDGHGMTATNSHGFVFSDFPATRMAWPGSWREVMEGTGGTGSIGMTAPFVGIVDAAMQHMQRELEGRSRRAQELHAFEQVEWTAALREAWLVHQAYEGALSAIERKGRARHEVALAKASIAMLAESILTRLCRLSGGGAFARHSPLGGWFEDVRALGFLRPSWALAQDALFALGQQGLPDVNHCAVT